MSRPIKDRADLVQILSKVIEQTSTACAGVPFRLVGTAAALLQGVDLPVGDIDFLLKERSGVDAFASALGFFPCITPPIYLEQPRQYFTEIDVDGVEVEISTVEWEMTSDGIETIGPGPWQHFVLLPCGKFTIPVVCLELRLVTELVRNRADRYQPILAYFHTHGCDKELVRLGLQAGGAPKDWIEKVITKI